MYLKKLAVFNERHYRYEGYQHKLLCHSLLLSVQNFLCEFCSPDLGRNPSLPSFPSLLPLFFPVSFQRWLQLCSGSQFSSSELQKILNRKNQHCLRTHETCTFSSHTQTPQMPRHYLPEDRNWLFCFWLLLLLLIIIFYLYKVHQWSPSFLAPRTGFREDNFSIDQGWKNGLGMIQVIYTHCAHDFYYYYISSTSDHQTLDLRGWRLLRYGIG